MEFVFFSFLLTQIFHLQLNRIFFFFKWYTLRSVDMFHIIFLNINSKCSTLSIFNFVFYNFFNLLYSYPESNVNMQLLLLLFFFFFFLNNLYSLVRDNGIFLNSLKQFLSFQKNLLLFISEFQT